VIILDKYQIIEEVGRGGMGLVYRAQDLRLGRTVAIKELIVSDAIIGQERDDIIARFKREAQTAANLSHPNIVTIFDVGEENNRHFIAMEYLPGKTLKDYLDEGYDYQLEEVLDFLIQIASGLEHAHSRGVVHRDIKPGNMKILEDNVVKVTDFGVARIESNNTSLTQDGTMLGTLGYISPEQLHNSKGVDSRADIFSFGAMMYEIFTKKLPFDGGTIGSTILKIMTEEPIPPRKIDPEIPETIEKIILKCLIKDPDKRYQKVKEVVKELTFFKIMLENDSQPLSQKFVKNMAESVSLSATVSSAIPQNVGEKVKENFQEENQIFLDKTSPQSLFKKPITNNNQTVIENKSETNTQTNSQNETLSEAIPEIRISFIRVIGKMGNANGQFSSPRGLALSKQNILFVADTQNKRVQAFDSQGGYQYMLQDVEMQSPCAVAVDSTGKVYVLDSVDAKVRVFDQSGKLLKKFGGKGNSRGLMASVSGIAIGDEDKIYITDTEGYKVHIFDNQGQFISTFGKYGTKPGDFKSPYGITSDSGKIYVLDYGVPRVQVFDKEGVSRLIFGQRGTGKAEFSIPKGIAVDAYGRIFVADTLNHRVQIFDSKGRWLYAFGSKGIGQGQFMGPESIAINGDGLIFVLDKGNNRFQVFSGNS